MNYSITTATCLAVFFLILSPRSSPAQIVYINVALIQDKPALESLKVVPGKLKQPKQMKMPDGFLYYSVYDSKNKMLHEGTLHDPSNKMVEYTDSNGELHTKIIRQDSSHLYLRIPFQPDIHTITFERIKEWSLWGIPLMKRKQKLGSLKLAMHEAQHEK